LAQSWEPRQSRVQPSEQNMLRGRLIFSGSPASDKPLVVVLGWWGAKDRAVSKFAKLHEDRNLKVCRITATTSELVWASKKRATAQALLEELHQHSAESCGIVFHLMSNNGAVLYSAMLGHAKREPCHEWFFGAVRGVIFDCSPGALTLQTGVGAILAGRPSLGIRCAFFAAPTMLLPALVRYFQRRPMAGLGLLMAIVIIMCTASRRTNNRYHQALVNDPIKCPQLFLYSQADHLVDHRIVRFILHSRRKKGIEVMEQCWISGAHMALLLEHSLEYRAALNEFFTKIGILANKLGNDN